MYDYFRYQMIRTLQKHDKLELVNLLEELRFSQQSCNNMFFISRMTVSRRNTFFIRYMNGQRKLPISFEIQDSSGSGVILKFKSWIISISNFLVAILFVLNLIGFLIAGSIIVYFIALLCFAVLVAIVMRISSQIQVDEIIESLVKELNYRWSLNQNN